MIWMPALGLLVHAFITFEGVILSFVADSKVYNELEGG